MVIPLCIRERAWKEEESGLQVPVFTVTLLRVPPPWKTQGLLLLHVFSAQHRHLEPHVCPACRSCVYFSRGNLRVAG